MKHGAVKLSHNESSEEEDTSSSEDDEKAELLTEGIEKEFFKVLSQLKKKDSELYKGSRNFFKTEDSEDLKQDHKGKKDQKNQLSESDYKKWLKGEKKQVGNDKLEKDFSGLHDFWANPKLSKNERFLRDYILNKKFLELDENFNIEKEMENLSEEEKEVQKQLVFEEKYNHRFEAPNDDFLKQYPKTMERAFKKMRTSDNSYKAKVQSELKASDPNVLDTDKVVNKEKPKKKKNRWFTEISVAESTVRNKNKIQDLNKELKEHKTNKSDQITKNESKDLVAKKENRPTKFVVKASKKKNSFLSEEVNVLNNGECKGSEKTGNDARKKLKNTKLQSENSVAKNSENLNENRTNVKKGRKRKSIEKNLKLVKNKKMKMNGDVINNSSVSPTFKEQRISMENTLKLVKKDHNLNVSPKFKKQRKRKKLSSETRGNKTNIEDLLVKIRRSDSVDQDQTIKTKLERKSVTEEDRRKSIPTEKNQDNIAVASKPEVAPIKQTPSKKKKKIKDVQKIKIKEKTHRKKKPRHRVSRKISLTSNNES